MLFHFCIGNGPKSFARHHHHHLSPMFCCPRCYLWRQDWMIMRDDIPCRFFHLTLATRREEQITDGWWISSALGCRSLKLTGAKRREFSGMIQFITGNHPSNPHSLRLAPGNHQWVNFFSDNQLMFLWIQRRFSQFWLWKIMWCTLW